MKTLKAFVCFGLIFTLNLSPLLVFAEDVIDSQNVSSSQTQVTTEIPQDQSVDKISQLEGSKGNDLENGQKPDPVESPSEIDTITQTQNSQFSVPSGVKTPELTYQQKVNASVDTFSGAFVQSIPIEIPKGRNSIEPNLNLQYNNQNVDPYSYLGSGWSLSIPSIERLNKTGIEKVYTDNYFTSSLSGELASTSEATVFRAKNESGDFLAYTLIGNTWTVLDKNGLTYVFGRTDDARQFADGISASTTKWMLSEVRDRNNNFYRYEYSKDGNEIYPSKVLYTGNGVEDGIYSVEFVLENRPDTYVSYKNGYKVEIRKRIKDILVKIDSIERGRYTLGYVSGTNGTKSLLASVTESKISTTGQIVTLPPTTFEYTNDPVSYVQRNDTYNGATRAGYDRNGYAVVDLDGNGLNERLSSIMVNDSNPNQGGQLAYALNKGFQHTEGINKIIQRAWSINGENGAVDFANLGTRIFDVNGDLLPDLVYAPEINFGWVPTSKDQIYFNTGNNDFATTSALLEENFPTFKYSTYSGGAGSGASGAVLLLNVNGDSLVDTYSASTQCTGATAPGPYNGYCSGNGSYIGTGFGWKMPTPQNVNGGQISGQEFPPIFLFADVNGDGLDDRIQQYDASTTVVYLNFGNNTWSDTPSTWSIPQPLQEGPYNYDQGVRVVDINGDGLVDIIRSYYIDYPDNVWNDSFIYTGRSMPLPSKGNVHVLYLNTGSSWQVVNSAQAPQIFNIVDNIEIIANHWHGKFLVNDSYFDADGDGLLDFGNSIRQGRKPDMLVKTTYSTGGTVNVDYKSTAAEDYNGNTYQTNPNLASVIYAVSTLTKDSGNGSPEVSEYMYEGGKNDFRGPNTLKFAGFKKVTETKGNHKTVTYFHQGDDSDTSIGETGDEYGKIGKVFKEVLTDLTDHVYKTTSYRWTTFDRGQGSRYTYLASTLEQSYDGNTTHKDTAVANIYDTTNGNLTQKTEYGEVVGATDGTFSDVGNDKKVTEYLYATSGHFSIPSEITTTDSVGALIEKTRIYYDNLPLGSVSSGNQTKKEQAISANTYVVSNKTYNSFGLVTEDKDPNNNATTYIYDTYHLYPVTVTNALNQTTGYTYDYLSGKPLTITTPNNGVFVNTYDGLGRPLEEKIPATSGGSDTKTRYEYVDTPNAISVKQSDYLDESNNVDSYTYFDSLGRKVQTKKEGEFGNWITNDFAYDNQGELSKETLPYFTTTNIKTAPLTNARLFISYIYDVLGRPVVITTVLGNTTITYDDWQKTTTDPLNHVKKYTSDAWGNLMQVIEVLDGANLVTSYQYNLQNKLIKITDANGNVRNFTYDMLGRRKTAEDLHTVSDTTFGTYTFMYDPVGNLTQKTTPKNDIVTYEYDPLNRISIEDTTTTNDGLVMYTYDTCTNGIGLLCGVKKQQYTKILTYTPMQFVSKETITINDQPFESSYVYDRQGNVTQMKTPNNDIISYGYNNAGLLEEVEYTRGGSSRRGGQSTPTYILVDTLNYSPTGTIAYQKNGNGTETCNTYDAEHLYRLWFKKTGVGIACPESGGATTAATTTLLQNLEYSYDGVNNINKIIDTSNTSTAKTVDYTYDGLYRLKTALTTNALTNYNETYSYDSVGNILTHNTEAYIYAGSSFANPHAAIQIGASSLLYDANGNATTIGTPTATTTNVWNYKNELVETDTSSTTLTYAYDESGNRVYKNIDGLHDSFYPSHLYNVVGKISSTYIYAGDTLLATIEKSINNYINPAGVFYWNHVDHLGSVALTTDSNAQPVETTTYLPYGQEQPSTNTTHQEQKKYIGEYRDTETDLNYLNARYYDGGRGRFLSEDPVFWEVGQTDDGKKALINPQLQNSYSYAGNNPITNKDPQGRFVTPLDAILTIGFLSYDIYHLTQEGSTKSNIANLGLDATGLVPFVPSVGLAAIKGIVDTGKVVNEISKISKNTLEVGKYADDAITARSTARDFTKVERDRLNSIGKDTGCHTCGNKDPGTKSGNFVPDHQPVSATVPQGTPQKLYPQCINCSRVQGGQVRSLQSKLK